MEQLGNLDIERLGFWADICKKIEKANEKHIKKNSKGK